MSCPSAEPSATPFEYGMYVGIHLQDILYGIELVLYFRTMRIFLARRGQPHRSDLFYAVFSTVMLLLTTTWVAALSAFGQKMWLLDRNYPGGPMAYHTANSSALYMDFGRFSLLFLQQMADALMIYRCRVVWGRRRVIILPSIQWLVNLGLGILLDLTSSMPGSTFFSGITVNLGLAYYSSSTFLNVALSCVICYRLLCHARTVKHYLGGRHASPYITMVALVVESVLPFALSSTAFLVSYGIESQSGVVFSFIHPLVMCLSPQVLIFRVAMAEAWQKEDSMSRPLSIIRTLSAHADRPSLRRFGGSGVVVQLRTFPTVERQPSHEDDQV